MNRNDLPADATRGAETDESDASSLLSPLLLGDVTSSREGSVAQAARIQGVVIGELLALTDAGSTALVRFIGQVGEGAVAARSSVDLHGPHIGGAVVLMFEQGDPTRPIVVGVMRDRAGWPMDEKPAQVEVDADGQRLIVNAREQLVLRCGKASITLTKAGKVLVEGTYVLSRSTGVNRIKGGSVQLN
jgi:hypothetical protein